MNEFADQGLAHEDGLTDEINYGGMLLRRQIGFALGGLAIAILGGREVASGDGIEAVAVMLGGVVISSVMIKNILPMRKTIEQLRVEDQIRELNHLLEL